MTTPQNEGSITQWIGELRNGNNDAAQALRDRYCPDLVRLARGKLVGQRPRMADEEDIALSAMNSFVQGIREGEFNELKNRNELWRLLSVLTWRKAVNVIRKNQCRPVEGESAFGAPDGPGGGIAQVRGDALPAEMIAAFNDEIRHMFELLEPKLQYIAMKKLEGFRNREIAELADCSVATIERRLQLIRKIWNRESSINIP